MSINLLDPQAEQLFDPQIELIRLANGFTFTEGPVWNAEEQCLYFSDIPANKIFKYTKKNGIEVYRHPSNFANGLTYDNEGRLIACEHQTRGITRTATSGEIELLASHFEGKPLNSPNDVIVASDGSIIFTDPHYGLGEGVGGPATQELSHRGVYRVIPGQDPILLTTLLDGPNGLALSPDEKYLYVDDSEHQHIRRFEVNDDWSVSGGEVWVELKSEKGLEYAPDGMKVDASGNIFCTARGDIWVLSPQGKPIAHIEVPEITSNLNWGDDDYSALYITARTGLYKLKTRTHK